MDLGADINSISDDDSLEGDFIDSSEGEGEGEDETQVIHSGFC